jgi:D,D-heptose 1,7-bisphosphate phosphatase
VTVYVKQAVILVGGKGTRLGALTADTPKPLLPIVDGLSFLDLLLENVARHGYEKILLLAGHLGDQLVNRYQGRRILQSELTVVREPEPRGTAGALRIAADQLDEVFLLSNGDSIFDINYRALEQCLTADFASAVALRRVSDAARFGTVEFADGIITAFREKTGEPGPALINGGVYVMRRSVLDKITSLPASLERDIFPAFAAAGKLAAKECHGYFLDIGLPETLQQARHELGPLRARPIAFLDRDGVLNQDTGWSHKPEELLWVPGAKRAVRLLNDAGFLAIVVSNQAGVAKGLYAEKQVAAFNAAIAQGLLAEGAHVDAFYHCPYHPEGTVAAYTRESEDRKPNAGMLLRAFADWPHVKTGSFLIGDKTSDIEAAGRAGIPGYLFSEGRLDRFVEGLPEVQAKRALAIDEP